jgi:pimeloyl-ACP methyl ester carboxylesterase
MSVLEGTWTSKYIITNGVKLHYVTQGDGPLMLMLHGFPEFWYSWRHQIPEFAQDYQVVALDLRGYNNSEKPTETSAYTIAELIKDVAGVIHGLGYETCVLVGHDWGGAIAWSFAYEHPDMVEKLIVMNIPIQLNLLKRFAVIYNIYNAVGISFSFNSPCYQKSGYSGMTMARSPLYLPRWRSINPRLL